MRPWRDVQSNNRFCNFDRDGPGTLSGETIIREMAGIWAHARLLVDIWSMKLFVWALGHNGELLDSHLFFFDRYLDLADHHRLKGRTANAERLAAIAETHYQAAPDDEPPEAAAMAMPVPRPPVNTNAVSTTRMTPNDPRGGHRIFRAFACAVAIRSALNGLCAILARLVGAPRGVNRAG
jgi:hypothetical protein